MMVARQKELALGNILALTGTVFAMTVRISFPLPCAAWRSRAGLVMQIGG
jgi:hypothetical protein